MKKRLFGLLLASCMLLSACQGKKNEAVYGFVNGKVVLVPGDKFSADTDGLGETVKYMEAPSCYYEGLDKVFTYDGYEVITYPANGGDYIQDISVTGTNFKTDKGIAVGDTLEAVTKAYGEDLTVLGKMYQYYVNDTQYIYFFIVDDVVKYYGYSMKIN